MLTFATPFLHRTRIRDPGSGIRDEQILGSGSVIRDKTSRIRNTDMFYGLKSLLKILIPAIVDPDLLVRSGSFKISNNFGISRSGSQIGIRVKVNSPDLRNMLLHL
jgi:hypothetical protein